MNSFLQLDPSWIDKPSPEIAQTPNGSGYSAKLQAADTIDVLKGACGSASREFPKALWLDASQRADKARENDKNNTWGINYVDRFTNQNPTHECTCHMLRTEFEGCRNRQRGIIYPDGPVEDFRYAESSRGSVWVSPLSIYAEANPGQWGGASCWQVLQIAIKRGFLPEKIQPHDYKFKHSMQGTTGAGGKNQSRGNWLSIRNFPEGWEETAKWLKPLEIIFTQDWEEALCLLLHGRILGYGRDGHAVPPSIYNVASQAIGYVDSYDVVRWDSLNTFKRAVASGVHCIESVTTPDDWMNPAGTLAV